VWLSCWQLNVLSLHWKINSYNHECPPDCPLCSIGILILKWFHFFSKILLLQLFMVTNLVIPFLSMRWCSFYFYVTFNLIIIWFKSNLFALYCKYLPQKLIFLSAKVHSLLVCIFLTMYLCNLKCGGFQTKTCSQCFFLSCLEFGCYISIFCFTELD